MTRRPPKSYVWKCDDDGSVGRRLADVIALHQDANPIAQTFGTRGDLWFYVRLADGGSDGHLYPSAEGAVNAATAEPSRIFVMRIPPTRPTPQAMDVIVWWQRRKADRPETRDPRHRIMTPRGIYRLTARGDLQP